MANRYIIISSTKMKTLMEEMEKYHIEDLGSLVVNNSQFCQSFLGELLKSKEAAEKLLAEPKKPVTLGDIVKESVKPKKAPAKPKAKAKAKAKPKGPAFPKVTKKATASKMQPGTETGKP